MRHIDTAQTYHDERAVADAIRDSGLPRGDIWLTTKLLPEKEYGQNIPEGDESFPAFDFNGTLTALRGSLETARLEYFDLFLIHSPQDESRRVEQWRALLHARDVYMLCPTNTTTSNVKA